MRPLVIHREPEEFLIEEKDRSAIFCKSHQVLGHGIIEGIYDIVAVDNNLFNRAASRDVAKEIAAI